MNSIVLSLVICFGFFGEIEANSKKQQKQALRKQALAKKPKPMFLMKKATEDLDVEEPKQDIQQRQRTTVVLDARFDSLD